MRRFCRIKQRITPETGREGDGPARRGYECGTRSTSPPGLICSWFLWTSCAASGDAPAGRWPKRCEGKRGDITPYLRRLDRKASGDEAWHERLAENGRRALHKLFRRPGSTQGSPVARG